jgi:hypothetical protein
VCSSALTTNGLLAGEAIASVSVAYVSGGAASNAAVRTYTNTIEISEATGFDTNNYTITYVPTNLTVTGGPFVFTIDTTRTNTGSSVTNQFKLPTVSSGTYNMSVDWGDGSSDGLGERCLAGARLVLDEQMALCHQAGHRQADLFGLPAQHLADCGLDARDCRCPLFACGDVFVGTDHR